MAGAGAPSAPAEGVTDLAIGSSDWLGLNCLRDILSIDLGSTDIGLSVNAATLDPNLSKATMKIVEIAFTGYCVTNMKRARTFYEDVLGLQASRTWGEEPNPGWVEYDLGAGCLAVIKGDGELWKPSPFGTAAAFEVDDFDAYVKKVKDAGVKIVMDTYESPVCSMITIADSDDNRIVLHKRK